MTPVPTSRRFARGPRSRPTSSGVAEEDVQHIEEWSVTEMDRIRSEADRKIEDRREPG